MSPFMPANITAKTDMARAAEDDIEARYLQKHRCRYRSATTSGNVACNDCRGRITLPAYECSKHGGQCVELRRAVAVEIRWCHTCADRALE